MLENLTNQVGNLDLTIELGDILENEVGSILLALAARLISKKSVNIDALLRVHRRIWTKIGGLEMKDVDKYTYILYFEEEELESALKRAQ